MTLPTGPPKSEDTSKQEEVIDRLINEVRNYKTKLQEIREAISRAGIDFEKLTVIGAIKKLLLDNKELISEVSALFKEIDNLRRKK
jgi:uncharacterized protein YacL (UPF0231 family)